jgi:prepilin-type N-terminal cleavage/methylation domain-containing protein
MRNKSGFTLVELMIASMVLLVASMGLVAAFVAAVNLQETTRETTLAAQAAREKIEEIQGADFDSAFATFSAAMNFAVEGLTPVEWDPDGMVGSVYFPVSAADPTLLDEAFVTDGGEMPRDLNGDGDAVDTLNTGYLILPVMVEINWLSKTGERTYQIVTFVVER